MVGSIRSGVLSVVVACGLLVACQDGTSRSGSFAVRQSDVVADWPEYGGDKGGLNYSQLDQIDRSNVAYLQPAWEYRHGDASDGKGDYAKSSFQSRSIVADGRLYFCTGFNRVVALDPEDGTELWSFDPDLEAKTGEGPYTLACRGVAYWSDSKAGSASVGSDDTCVKRIFTGTRDSELIALDAATGQLCKEFGRSGIVELREGIGEAPAWEYYPTSPPIAVGDVVVIGALVADSLRVDAPSGVVRAFHARSGALVWAWDPVPPGWTQRRHENSGQDGSLDHGSYESGTPNVWSLLSADEERGLVFVPTGNPSPDSYGGTRDGIDYYGSSVVALDAKTGELRWHFQTVHHDVWDYDVPAQPTLFQLDGVGGGEPGVAQATKMGHIFLLNRDTGTPMYRVEERPVPGNGVPGETLAETQPFPTHPSSLHPSRLTPEDAWGFTPFDRGYCRKLIEKYRSDGIFTPPSLEGSIQYPGNAGGPNWGGVSVDPATATLFVNQMRSAAVVTLIPRADFDRLDPSSVVYPQELYPMNGTPYGVKREPLLSNFGAPCVAPPWGTLTAVDLRSGEVRWEINLGTTRDQAPWPLWFNVGVPNLGGSIVTAGGLLFISATTDKFLRAFDTSTGEELWRHRLPFTGNASPSTYRLSESSRQFVVISAGGHGWSESGDAVMAFALPEQ